MLQLSGATLVWGVTLSRGAASLSALMHLPALVWASFAYVVLIGCTLCFFLHYWLLGHIEGHKLAFFDGIHTIGAAVWGAIFFGDRFNTMMLLGGGLLVSALVFIARSKRESEVGLYDRPKAGPVELNQA